MLHQWRQWGSVVKDQRLIPVFFFVYRGNGSAVGVFATHIDDILGCGEVGVMGKLREFSELRFGELKLQEGEFVHVGMELEQDAVFSATLTQKEFTENLKPLGTSPRLWAARQKRLSPEDVKLCQCKLGELCWLVRVSRPDICARLARISSRINELTGGDVYRINDLEKLRSNGSQRPRLSMRLLFNGIKPLGV